MDYKDKYLKYKTKYLEIKDIIQIAGGDDTVKKIFDDIITENKLAISYSIHYNNVFIDRNANKVYPIHSISKLFTNILLVLLFNDIIITEEELNMPLKLDSSVLKKLSKDVRERLEYVSLLDCIKHEAGLKDYLNKYHKKLQECFIEKKDFPNPIEPEDFIIYADKDVLDKKEVGKRNYSNLGILLAALSLKYHFNNKYNKNNIIFTYNEILYLYIIKKNRLNSFSITKPDNAVFPVAKDDLTRYVNGTPASGYWMSAKDLCKFGIWINKIFNNHQNIKYFVTKYQLDIYWKNPLRIGHWGFLHTSSACLETFLRKNITIAVLSNHDDDAHIFIRKIKKILN
jgi:hypothetical protein